MEFPITAQVEHQYVEPPAGDHWSLAQYIQGGALRTQIQLPGDPDACPSSESPLSKSTPRAPWRDFLMMREEQLAVWEVSRQQGNIAGFVADFLGRCRL